jgi:hypothetical protein
MTSKPWSMRKQLGVAAGISALLVLAVVSATAGDDSPSTATDSPTYSVTDNSNVPKSQPAAPKPKPKPKKVLTVDAHKLVQEFEGSEFKADKKYDGKTLKITGGTVSSIDAQIWDEDKYDVSFADSDDFWNITCENVKNKYLDVLSPGDDVTVVGKFKDGGDLGIQLKSCTFA